jgi:hypothetical protein
VGPESANNSVEAGDLIPTLLFGIPGGVPSAMLLGMLLTYGIQPGPSIITEHLDLMYLIVWSFAIASILGALFCFLSVKRLAKLTKVPFAVLAAGLVAIMLLGSFQEGGQLGDLWIMIILGAFGWLLKSTGFPRAPFLIGFVLAIPLERYYFLTDSLYEGFDWMARPGVMVFLAILILPMIWALIKFIRARRHTNVDDGHRDEQPEDDEAPLKNSIWSLVASGIFFVAFASALVASFSYSPEARLVPQLVSTGGLIFSGILLFIEIRSRLRARTPKADATRAAAAEWILDAQPAKAGWTLDAKFALKTFLWITGFLALTAAFGYLVAVTIFIPAFLLVVARARLKTTVVYTLVLYVVLLALPSLLPIDLPQGWLNTLV